MQFKDVLQGAKEKAAEATGIATEKVTGMLDEYRKGIDMLEHFGFQVGRFHVGMGVLPEITTSVYGSIEDVDPDELRKLMDENRDRRLVSAMITALIAAKEFQQRADLVKFSGVTLDVKLGIPPKISFDLTESPVA